MHTIFHTEPPIALTALTSFDWFLIVLVVLSTLMAFGRGIIKVLFSLAGLILGIVLASWNYLAFAGWLHGYIRSFAAAQVVAFVTILVLVMALFTIAGSVLRRTAAAVGLGLFDRLLGSVFGLLRGVLLGVAAMMAIVAFLPRAGWLEHSQLAPYFLAGAHAVSFVVPEHLQEQLTTGARHLLQQSPELFRPRTRTYPRQDRL